MSSKGKAADRLGAVPSPETVSRLTSQRRTVLVLGSTGSIGTQTLDVISQHKDQLSLCGLSTYRSVDKLFDQVKRFGIYRVVIADETLKESPQVQMLSAYLSCYEDSYLGFGAEGIVELIENSAADIVVNALVGFAGLRASFATLQSGSTLALANKESLVAGGDLIMPLARNLPCREIRGDSLLPIDSEHGAIFQCLIGEDHNEVRRLWVTASGGPFRGMSLDALSHVTPEKALAHPTWKMGPKITIDSSTLMNKGLEVIEAHHLFDMAYEDIAVVVQPQSVIHSMVEFVDGSVKAHLGTTDMRIPIQFALSYPNRWEAPVAPLDFRELKSLEFAPPDEDNFRCLALAREAGLAGGTLPCAMNAANEIAVAAFLDGSLSYLGIACCVEAVMNSHRTEKVVSLEQLEWVDDWARGQARQWIGTHHS